MGWLMTDTTENTETISDGFHMMDELYYYRMLYNALAFNAFAAQGLYDVHKSRHHSDGELCFGGGWFIVVATLPTGQVTNHYEDTPENWAAFKCEEREIPVEYDGHTPEVAAQRIMDFLKS